MSSSQLPPLPELAPGRYRHYKGQEYDVVAVARHSETLAPVVVYRALYGDGGLWVRPHAMFCETVAVDGRAVRRFAPVEPDPNEAANIRPAVPSDHPALLAVWLESVRATHTFLTETDIAQLIPVVRDQALPHLEVWVLCDAHQQPIGFMGLDGNKVEALFMAPAHFGQGGGRRLLARARALKGALRVDVNEQNTGAAAFYQAQGFRQFGRSPTDAAGRPFPLLHLSEDGASFV